MSTQHTLTIEGMSCGHCVGAVREALASVAGVRVLAVEVGRAEVELDEGVTLEALAAALAEDDYRIAV